MAFAGVAMAGILFDSPRGRADGLASVTPIGKNSSSLDT